MDKLGLVFRDRESKIFLFTIEGENIRLSEIGDSTDKVYADLPFDVFEAVQVKELDGAVSLVSLYTLSVNEGEIRVSCIADLKKDDLVDLAADILTSVIEEEMTIPKGATIH